MIDETSMDYSMEIASTCCIEVPGALVQGAGRRAQGAGREGAGCGVQGTRYIELPDLGAVEELQVPSELMCDIIPPAVRQSRDANYMAQTKRTKELLLGSWHRGRLWVECGTAKIGLTLREGAFGSARVLDTGCAHWYCCQYWHRRDLPDPC